MSWWSGLLAFLLIIAINAGFVVAEVALLTSRKSNLHKASTHGSKAAAKILQMYSHPEKLLSTILIGITSVGVVLGALGEDTIGQTLDHALAPLPFIGEYSSILGEFSAIIVVVYITVFSELIPKRIAMLHPEKSAIATSYMIIFFYYVFYPIMMLLSFTSNWTLKLLRIKEAKQELSIEEFKMLLSQAEGHGAFELAETDMIKRLLNLGNMQVGTVMTPRSQMVCLELSDSETVNRERIINNPFNYFPVTDGGLPNIIGVVSAKQFLNHKFNNTTLQSCARSKTVIYIPEMAKLTNLMQMLREKKSRIAIVIDEYGGIEGIVTLNDILKTFVGDLATLVDGQKPTVQKKKEGFYVVSGSISVEEVMEIMDTNSLPGDEEEEYRTLASFILKQLNKVPKVNDHFSAAGWTFKVLNMDKFRISKVSMIKNQ